MATKAPPPTDSITVDQTLDTDNQPGVHLAVPGLLVVFSGGAPVFGTIRLDHGAVEISRGMSAGVPLDDPCLSRRHARVELSGTTWKVTDHGSRNGTGLDGTRILTTISSAQPQLIRAGDTLMFPMLDISPFVGATVAIRGETIVGPSLARSLDLISRASLTERHLHIHGESGSGKELAARTFHDSSSTPRGPFVAVNCATIPESIAERLLFGAKRGAFSGATEDADGYVQAAHGGTLFLDEIAELHLSVQAKLLRVLETREVLSLGASRPRPVEFRLCTATHRSLRAEVANGRFREDLYFRIARPIVELAALRDRREDIPWFIDRELRGVSPTLRATAPLVEAALLRPWPGNVRELRLEIESAARVALGEGATKVEVRHLADGAGAAFSASVPTSGSLGPSSVSTSSGNVRNVATPSREALESALSSAGGNISQAARNLGVHRTQLRRWLIKHGLASSSAPSNDPEE